MNTEKSFLEKYRLEDYDRPSVATDVVALSLRTKDTDSFRKDPELVLSVLLIERGAHPFLGKWALPGGFVKMDETVEQGAQREIFEETNVVPSSLNHVGVFSKVDRDPRGRVISNAFACVFSEIPKTSAGSDAKSARWFDVNLDLLADSCYLLRLQSDDIVLSSEINVTKSQLGFFDVEIKNKDMLAFDHAEIIFKALTQLKERAEKFDLIFDFLPQKFTLTSLQRVWEALTGEKSVPANFRRKVNEFVEKTDEYTQGAGHRPAMLFTRKKDSNNE